MCNQNICFMEKQGNDPRIFITYSSLSSPLINGAILGARIIKPALSGADTLTLSRDKTLSFLSPPSENSLLQKERTNSLWEQSLSVLRRWSRC